MPEDANVEGGFISTASPIGRALLNKEDRGRGRRPDAERRRAPFRDRQTRHDPRRVSAHQRRPRPRLPGRPYSTRLRTALDPDRAPAPPARITPACCARCTRRAAHRSRRRPRHRRHRRDVRRGRRRPAALGQDGAVEAGQPRARLSLARSRCASPAGRSSAAAALLAVPLVLLAFGVDRRARRRAAVAGHARCRLDAPSTSAYARVARRAVRARRASDDRAAAHRLLPARRRSARWRSSVVADGLARAGTAARACTARCGG